MCCLYLLSLLLLFIFFSYPRHTASPLIRGRVLLQIEESGEGVDMVVLCHPASGVDLELYTPELLFHQQPLEAPVSCSVQQERGAHTGSVQQGEPSALSHIQHIHSNVQR